MSLDISKGRQLTELYTGRDINPELFLEVVNAILPEFAEETAVTEKDFSITSVSGTTEYELPLGVTHVTDVVYDGTRAHKIIRKQVKELTGDV